MPDPIDPRLAELCQLFADDALDQSLEEELNTLLRNDASMRDAFVAYCIHSQLLQEVLKRDKVSEIEPPVDRVLPVKTQISRRFIAFAAIAGVAASLLVAVAVWHYWPATPEPQITEGDSSPLSPVDPTPASPVELVAAHWEITPTGEAVYEFLEPTHVRLDRGELLAELVGGENREQPPRSSEPTELRITTPEGEAIARGTRFIVGTHQTNPEEEKPMLRSLTRVFVLSGLVTLSTSLGSIEGTPGELLAAEVDKAPFKLTMEANSDFAWDLYAQIAKENEDGNLFFSPYSISSALAMTMEGARGQTAREMGDVLRFPDAVRRIGVDDQRIPWETAKIHTGMGTINDRLNREKKPYSLKVANALWGEQSYRWRPEFLKALDEPYGALLRKVDFIHNPERERQRINQWVEDQTEQKIKELLPKDPPVITGNTRLVLTNAIYFKGNWSQRFDAKQTNDLQFTTASGEKVAAPTMWFDPLHADNKRNTFNGYFPFGYAAFDAQGNRTSNRGKTHLEILEMPYAGHELSMFVLLPRKHDGVPELEQQLNRRNLVRWLRTVEKGEVEVYLPKFKMEMEYKMVPTLTELGMPTAFSGNADFTGLCESGGLSISSVRHKAFVEVNEVGTEAAAATAVEVTESAAPPARTFKALRPFIFLILDNKTGSILFAGRMMNPTGEQ
ncbi:serpin family protein [Planctomycetaceae bacterium SH139]